MAAAPNSVDTGTFNDGELRPWTEAKAGVGSAKTVNFSPAYVAAPSLAWGLSTIDLPYQGNLGLTAHLENITASSMKVHLDPIQNSTVYNSAVNWFETKDRDFQTGSQELVWSISGQVPQPRVNPVFIRFNRPYHKPPRVVVWLAGFQISKDFNARLYCYPSQITEFGFYLNAATWGDTVVNLSYHTWIAYPIDKVGVTSAICNTSDVRDGGQIEIKEVGFLNTLLTFKMLIMCRFLKMSNFRLVHSIPNMGLSQ
jgi:hypothetical protein